MKHRSVIPLASVLALGAALVAAPPVNAAPPVGPLEDFLFEFPAGVGCPDFALNVEGIDSNLRVREFTDEDDNVVRVIIAGLGYSVTYTNVDTGKSISYKARGYAEAVTVDPETGITTVRSSGHFGLILFPTDVPPGPSATSYVGTVVYTVDANDVGTIVSTSGKSVDVCAALM